MCAGFPGPGRGIALLRGVPLADCAAWGVGRRATFRPSKSAVLPGSEERLEEAAAQLVTSKSKKKKTSTNFERTGATIPIVFGFSGDPILAGFVETLARPGRKRHGRVVPGPGARRQVAGRCSRTWCRSSRGLRSSPVPSILVSKPSCAPRRPRRRPSRPDPRVFPGAHAAGAGAGVRGDSKIAKRGGGGLIRRLDAAHSRAHRPASGSSSECRSSRGWAQFAES